MEKDLNTQINELKKLKQKALRNSEVQRKKQKSGKSIITKPEFWNRIVANYDFEINQIKLINDKCIRTNS